MNGIMNRAQRRAYYKNLFRVRKPQSTVPAYLGGYSLIYGLILRAINRINRGIA
ncbi:hypothetical protein FDH29_gp18 [Aquamicrobium phage P14]|uniref:Uncharacterized protein n=1 Tax=Aquamicrobium phage P14 TaxID=1927013 RepID=A0A1L5C043_9CAUD|nr:hypothetical protein FDH29_gp18 [Aquamicrobium phage P14]APL99476.1 hypothetical protein BB738_0180 [Aquamicrobium phage P14]